ncbi:hypothetical protein HAX54_043734 [Datura stramonium]|uniref:Uncharacterized protein n=1 Tax=Datura stramonium TaxID=4076 RepID=A0ABS8SP20_DATST|nr:hypothetical protein [Datura stramonium]
MNCAEGTGSNELIYNNDGVEVHRRNASTENPPSFTPLEFLKKSKKGDIVEGEKLGAQTETATAKKSTDKAVRRIQLQKLIAKSINWGSLWMMAGDYNDIIDNSEKSRTRVREISSFRVFRIFLWDIRAIDLGFNGKP